MRTAFRTVRKLRFFLFEMAPKGRIGAERRFPSAWGNRAKAGRELDSSEELSAQPEAHVAG